MDHLKRLGIQKRIMAYVTVGLTVIFASFAVVSLGSIEQAIGLVYDERLNMAHSTAGVLARDFLHVARDVREVPWSTAAADDQPLSIATAKLLNHLARTDPFPFFHVTGIWLLSPNGAVAARAGQPVSVSGKDVAALLGAAAEIPDAGFRALPPVGSLSEGVPFATVLTPVGDQAGPDRFLAAVHIVSINSPAPYVPPSYWYATAARPPAAPQGPQAAYHLEVVEPGGLAVLGIGEDETPGAPSRHFPALEKLMAEGRPAALLHEPAPGEVFDPHVMAAVPVESSGFWVVLEQPVDVALALPLEVRWNILVLTALGFAGALIVAWITTRHVVQPARELNVAAQRMAGGDLETPIRVTAQDEVGSLAESLDLMRRQLRAAYAGVENANRDLEVQVRERTARLEEVLKKVISAQEEERHRLARELHDETAQTLGALSIALDRARESLGGASPAARERLVEAKDSATRLLGETRRLILALRPLILDDLGLGPAIRWYAETHLEEQGVEVTIEIDQGATRLAGHIETSLFRVMQEAVNNVARHADASHAVIRLSRQNGTVQIIVADDGRGFDVERVLGGDAPLESIGLVGMQERVRLLNGRLDICSRKGKGTTLTAEVPIAIEGE